jgi:hypothetical protein
VKKISLFAFLLLNINNISADMITYKSILKDNGTFKFKNTPLFSKTMNHWFLKGTYATKIKSNYFTYIKDGNDYNVYGVGSSIKYRTASFKDVYISAEADIVLHPISSAIPNNIGGFNKGIDLINKEQYMNGGRDDWYSIPELNITYQPSRYFYMRYGYQGYDNLLVAENDTKMVKNSFSGLSMLYANDTFNYKGAVFNKQKLRNHTDYHDVIKYNGYSENDDSGAHRGLTTSNGLDFDTYLTLNELNLSFIPKTKISISNAYVNQLFSSTITDIKYFIPFRGYNVIFGGRYFLQQDLGAGKIGGASLSGKKDATGYKDINSVASSMYAGNMSIKTNDSVYMFGYSKVDDKADIITPWRNFATKGYTRSMGITNWYSNTESYMVQMKTKLDKYGIAVLDYTYVDNDETKIDTRGNFLQDFQVYHLDYTINNFSSIRNLQLKTRYSYITFEDGHVEQDIRTEFNYLF